MPSVVQILVSIRFKEYVINSKLIFIIFVCKIYLLANVVKHKSSHNILFVRLRKLYLFKKLLTPSH